MSDRLAAAMNVDKQRRDAPRGPPLGIYVIEEVGSDLCKVGMTSDGDVRCRELQLGNSRELALRLFHPVPNPRRIERMTHSLLWSKQARGEWFAVSVSEAVSAVEQALRDEAGKSDVGFKGQPLAGGWPARHAERSP